MGSPSAGVLRSRLDDSVRDAAKFAVSCCTEAQRRALTAACSTLPAPAEARRLVASTVDAGGLPDPTLAHLLLDYPAAQAFPQLLRIYRWRDMTMAAILLSSEKLPGQRMLLMELHAIAELLPLRLAQWVSAVSGEALDVVIGSIMPRAEAEALGVGACTLEWILVCVPDLINSNAGRETFELARHTAFEVSWREYTRLHSSDDVLAGVSSSASFRALWGWSGLVCSRLLGELTHVCAGSGACSGMAGYGGGECGPSRSQAGGTSGCAGCGEGQQGDGPLSAGLTCADVSRLCDVTPSQLEQAIVAIREADRTRARWQGS